MLIRLPLLPNLLSEPGARSCRFGPENGRHRSLYGAALGHKPGLLKATANNAAHERGADIYIGHF